MEENPEEVFIKKLFRQYYQNKKFDLPSIEKREFGFGGWEKKIEFRHIFAENENVLKAKIQTEVPLYISYSASYYKYPDARPMTKKEWLGADLIFDIDAKEHSCGKFTCKSCFEEVKEQTIRLIEEFLISDFGISKSEIFVNFSGSRGYHVHVRNEKMKELGREQRKEISDYITGSGLDFNSFFWEEEGKLFGPLASDGGYGGKFARRFIKEYADLSGKTHEIIRISKKLKEKEYLEKYFENIKNGRWDFPFGKTSVQKKKIAEIFEKMKEKISVRIDSNVTVDLTKLIRLPESLHGGTGFIAKKLNDLENFEPTKDAIAFKEGFVKIKTEERIPVIENLIEEEIPPQKEIELPSFSAVYLICKKAAKLSSQNF